MVAANPVDAAWPQLELLSRLFREVPDRLLVQCIRFGVVGGFALILDCSILFIAVRLFDWNHLLAACAGYTAGLLLNYVLSVRWVFSQRRFQNQRLEFVLFTATGLGGLALTELIIWCGTDRMSLDVHWSKLAAILCVAVWNFSVRKIWLFSKAPALDMI
jgi:putative flippase GtrA